MAGERILVTDDEPGVRETLALVLGDEGFQVEAVETAERALEVLEQQRFDAILLDVWLPGMDGLDALKQIRSRGTDAEVVMISGHGTIDTAVRATKLGAFDFIEKPLSLERTLLVLRNALRQRRLERVNRRLLDQLDRDTEILGTGPVSVALREQVERATEGQAPVLIEGAAGSGRENIARRLHVAGERRDGPFVEIPLASLDAAGAERMLFDGDGPGQRPGMAQRGTLFLEDIDVLPAELQRRLAAMLATWSRQPHAPRVLASAEQAGRLVESLRSLLDVLRIRVPLLRDRREDIAALAQQFLSGFALEYGRPPKPLSAAARQALESYDWPGEVRELKNLAERLTVTARGSEIALQDLPGEMGGRGEPGFGEDLYRQFDSLAQGLAAFESYYLRRILAESSGDLSVAAGRLGLDEGDLRKRVDALEPAER